MYVCNKIVVQGSLIRPFKGLIRPLKSLIRSFKGLIRPLKGLSFRDLLATNGRYPPLEVALKELKEAPGGSRRLQEAPGGSIRLHKAP